MTPMSDSEWYSSVALALALVVVVVFVAGLAVGGAFTPRAAAAAPAGPLSPAYLYFTVTTSAATHYDTFYPANVSVPHGQPIYIIITSYDPGVNNVSDPYTQVIGTVGGTANYSYGLNQTTKVISDLPNGQISHTFTVTLPGLLGTTLLGAGKPMINVPVPISPGGILPVTVTFEVTFDHSGQYEWRCIAPCDPYSMQTLGFMVGSIVVT